MQENREEELYDEFGNYVGPDLDSSDSDSSSDDSSQRSQTSAVSDLPDDNPNDLGNDDDPSHETAMATFEGQTLPQPTAPSSNAITLHEDKIHYPSAQTVYGPSVTTAVIDEDAMDIDTPIVTPVRQFVKEVTPSVLSKRNKAREENQLVSEGYLVDALLGNVDTTEGRRGVALVGNLNSGKTTLLDLLYRTTLVLPPEQAAKRLRDSLHSNHASSPNKNGGGQKPPRPYDPELDTPPHHKKTHTSATLPSPSELLRSLTLTSAPVTLPLRTTRSKTYAVTLLDTPGHTQFHDEAVSSLRSVDGAILVLDAVEGVTMHDAMLIRQSVAEGLPVCLVIHKIDRLIVELKLPVEDAYCKIRHLVEECNGVVGECGGGGGRYPVFCPGRGNVAFGSAEHGWCFTLGSWAEVYGDYVEANGGGGDDDDDDNDEGEEEGWLGSGGGHGGKGILGRNLPPEEFARRLWGDTYLCPTTRTFLRSKTRCRPTETSPPIVRTFVEFVLGPIYKIYASCLGEKEKEVGRVLRGVGVHLTRAVLRSSARVLLKVALGRFLGEPTGLVDVIVENV